MFFKRRRACGCSADRRAPEAKQPRTSTACGSTISSWAMVRSFSGKNKSPESKMRGGGEAAPIASRIQRLFRSGCGGGLLGDDHVLDLVVGRLWNNLFFHQICFDAIGTARNDFLLVGFANPRQTVQLILVGAVDVQQVCG